MEPTERNAAIEGYAFDIGFLAAMGHTDLDTAIECATDIALAEFGPAAMHPAIGGMISSGINTCWKIRLDIERGES